MSSKILKGKKGIIFGALNEQSIAWQVALKCKAEGADIILSNLPIAIRFCDTQQLAEQINAPVFGADITKIKDIEKLYDFSIGHFKGEKIDFMLHSVANSLNIRKKHEYTDLNYDFLNKTLDVSAISFHKLLQVAFEKDILNDWASVVAMSYIAAQRIFPQYNEMADAKVLLEGIARNFGYHYGVRRKVRINTVSQSPTMTRSGAGIDGFLQFMEYTEAMSPLGNAPAEDLAAFCAMLFSDYTKFITMQNLYHDGGFSTTGLTDKLVENIALKNGKVKLDENKLKK